MAFIEATFFGFMALFLLMAFFIFLMRRAKYGSVFSSLASTLSGGLAIVDKAGTGSVVELIGYEQNPNSKLIRLRLNSPQELREWQTPFIFKEEDFYPTLSMIDWNHYAGTITCYWDFERRKSWREIHNEALTHQIEVLKQQNGILKRTAKGLLEYYEKTKVPDAQINDSFAQAEALKTIKTLVNETNIDNVSPEGESKDSMFDN